MITMGDEAEILVVDDELDMIELVAFNLRAEGYEVIPASNGIEAAEPSPFRAARI